MQAFLNKDDTKTKRKMAEMLDIGHRTICDRLHVMGKIQKQRKWASHQLNNRQMKRRNHMINLNYPLIKKKPEWLTRHGRVILKFDNTPSHTTKAVRDTIFTLGWEVLSHPPYSLDLILSLYLLFWSMSHALSMKHFRNCGDVEKWLDEWTTL